MSKYEIDPLEVLRYLGGGKNPPAALMAQIEAVSREFQSGLTPRYVYQDYPPLFEAEGILLEGTSIRLQGQAIAQHLQGAVRVCVLAVTLGAEAERRLMRWQMTSLEKAAIADAAGSALTEAVADRCSEEIAAHARALNLHAGTRFSPGYGDLPLDVQPILLRALNAERRIGLTATVGNILLPRKSITALVGLFPTPRRAGSGCAGCNLYKNCVYRREGTHCAESIASK